MGGQNVREEVELSVLLARSSVEKSRIGAMAYCIVVRGQENAVIQLNRQRGDLELLTGREAGMDHFGQF